MINRIKGFLTKCLWVVIIVFIAEYFILGINSPYELFSMCGEAISITLVIMVGLYNCILWRYNPFEKTPKLKGKYDGKIEYYQFDDYMKKDIEVTIEQTLLSIRVNITTNEITSSTIISSIEKENNQDVLYYTYITNPKNRYSQENPIQYGTCRLLITDKGVLTGVYWTSRNTSGDIELKRHI